MPNYEVHRKMGFLVALILGVIIYVYLPSKMVLSPWQWLLLAFVVIFYSNLPDLDHHMGRLRKKTLTFIFLVMVLSSIISYFVNIGLMLVLLMLTGLLGLALLKVKHRGPLHTYWFVLIVSLPLLLVHWFLFVLAFICSSTHIFIDRLWSKTKRKVRKATGTQTQTKNYTFTFKW